VRPNDRWSSVRRRRGSLTYVSGWHLSARRHMQKASAREYRPIIRLCGVPWHNRAPGRHPAVYVFANRRVQLAFYVRFESRICAERRQCDLFHFADIRFRDHGDVFPRRRMCDCNSSAVGAQDSRMGGRVYRKRRLEFQAEASIGTASGRRCVYDRVRFSAAHGQDRGRGIKL
jgi:hypothetical protein